MIVAYRGSARNRSLIIGVCSIRFCSRFGLGFTANVIPGIASLMEEGDNLSCLGCDGRCLNKNNLFLSQDYSATNSRTAN